MNEYFYPCFYPIDESDSREMDYFHIKWLTLIIMIIMWIEISNDAMTCWMIIKYSK